MPGRLHVYSSKLQSCFCCSCWTLSLFAMAELAIVSARRERLQMLIDSGHRGAAVALRMAEEPTNLLSTVQVGITLIGILAGAFGGATLSEELAALLAPLPVIGEYSEVVALAVVVAGSSPSAASSWVSWFPSASRCAIRSASPPQSPGPCTFCRRSCVRWSVCSAGRLPSSCASSACAAMVGTRRSRRRRNPVCCMEQAAANPASLRPPSATWSRVSSASVTVSCDR